MNDETFTVSTGRRKHLLSVQTAAVACLSSSIMVRWVSNKKHSTTKTEMKPLTEQKPGELLVGRLSESSLRTAEDATITLRGLSSLKSYMPCSDGSDDGPILKDISNGQL